VLFTVKKQHTFAEKCGEKSREGLKTGVSLDNIYNRRNQGAISEETGLSMGGKEEKMNYENRVYRKDHLCPYGKGRSKKLPPRKD